MQGLLNQPLYLPLLMLLLHPVQVAGSVAQRGVAPRRQTAAAILLTGSAAVQTPAPGSSICEHSKQDTHTLPD